MRIHADLPKFEDEKILILVLSRQNAQFFIVKNGDIKMKDEIHVEKQRFAEKNSPLRRIKRKRRMMKAGALREKEKENLKNDLIRKFKEYFEFIISENNFDDVYLISSPHVIGEVPKIIKEVYKKEPKKVIEGNFTKAHPFKLIEKISLKE